MKLTITIVQRSKEGIAISSRKISGESKPTTPKLFAHSYGEIQILRRSKPKLCALSRSWSPLLHRAQVLASKISETAKAITPAVYKDFHRLMDGRKFMLSGATPRLLNEDGTLNQMNLEDGFHKIVNGAIFRVNAGKVAQPEAFFQEDIPRVLHGISEARTRKKKKQLTEEDVIDPRYSSPGNPAYKRPPGHLS